MPLLRASKRLRILRSSLKVKRQGAAKSAPASSAAAPAAQGEATAAGEAAAVAAPNPTGFSETELRNIALEAVRTGNYYAEDQEEVIAYIKQTYEELLVDAKFLKKYAAKLRKENDLIKKYTVEEILRKRPEADGYDVFVQAHEAIAMKAAAEAQEQRKEKHASIDPAKMGELQESLTMMVEAASGEGDPVGLDEMLEALDGCCEAGELGAAVYCGERIDKLYEDGMPDDILERVFQALKPFLRPSAASPFPRLTGPWTEAQFGERNHRKGLGKLLDKVAKLRQERKRAQGGEAAEKADRAAAGEKALASFCENLKPFLAADKEVLNCNRKAQLVAEMARVCRDKGVDVSNPVAWDVLRVLEESGQLEVDGRDVKLSLKAVKQTGSVLKVEKADVELMDALARERLQKRKQRQKARENTRQQKRQRT